MLVFNVKSIKVTNSENKIYNLPLQVGILSGQLSGQFANLHCPVVRTKVVDNWTISKKIQLKIRNFETNSILYLKINNKF